MRMIEYIDGALELRWTWLPYWLATNGRLKTELEREIKDFVLSRSLTTSDTDLNQVNEYLCGLIQARFPAFPGLGIALLGFMGIRDA